MTSAPPSTARSLARAFGIGLVGLACASCWTIDVVRAYNTGAHGTLGDPAVTPRDGSARLLRRMIVDEMGGSYFQSGADLAPWFDAAQSLFPSLVTRHFETEDGGASTRETRARKFGATGALGRFDDLDTSVRHAQADNEPPWMKVLQDDPDLCTDKRLNHTGEAFEDALRFQVSFTRALQTAREWYREGLIDPPSIGEGARDGFAVTGEYMKSRRFHRDATRPNVGIVVSGGASNGMFSAGAVWSLLGLVDDCLSDPQDCPVDPRFRLISGTSAGAMVAVVADIFNAKWEDGQGHLVASQHRGQPALDSLAQWFTCLPAQQLYCADNDASYSIFGNRVGIVEFDGARWLLGQYVDQGILGNTSELILNTVDFQSGALIAASDQNPADTSPTNGVCDVVNHALSSIPEPFVAQPVRLLDAGAGIGVGKMPVGFYLDGGVSSVVPLMPLVRRGADRAIVVSSAPSVVEGAAPPNQAFDVLTSFINISIGNNGVEGIDLAEAFANVQAEREQNLCEELCKKGATACAKRCGDPLGNLCDETAERRRGQNYPVATIYRNEGRVLPATGYSFDPRQSLPLFLAGMAEVRGRCKEFAAFLGLPVDKIPDKIEAWCNRPMPTAAICDASTLQWPLPDRKYSVKDPTKNPPELIRACDPSTWTNNPPRCP